MFSTKPVISPLGAATVEMVDLDELDEDDLRQLRILVENHHRYTESTVAGQTPRRLAVGFQELHKVIPIDYKRALSGIQGEYRFQAN